MPSRTGVPITRPDRESPSRSCNVAGPSGSLPGNGAGGEKLPDPFFPRRPDLLGDAPHPHDGERHWTPSQILHAIRGWLVPYVQSRVLPGEFQPVVAYLFTEWKCNVDCHYCWAYNNRVNGMTEETARAAIDWLHDTTCRVLALMGGEVLLRAKFAHKVVDYAARRGFWIYVPTNGRLLKPDLIDRLADAGTSVFNLALDVVREKPGLPKALGPIRQSFEYLLKKQYRYGYLVFLNINICRNNLDEVRELTDIAHEHGLSTDYHLNETPLLAQPHFRHLTDNPTFITPTDWPQVDALLDWIIDRQRHGYKMVNSIARLEQMKAFMRGALNEPWNCRAGRNTLIIRVDGSLAPCFPMYSSTHDWGTVGEPKFDSAQLDAMRGGCESRCFSTLNHMFGYCYNDARVIRWVLRQAANRFRPATGGFE